MSKVRFMIVDDQKSIRNLLTQIIESIGAEVVYEASDGYEAVDGYKAHKPHITLMDINMPKKDGVDALKEIIEINAGALVIMLTSQNSMEVVKDCLSYGARNFLLKDNSPEQLLQEIKQTWQDYKSEFKVAS